MEPQQAFRLDSFRELARNESVLVLQVVRVSFFVVIHDIATKLLVTFAA